MKHALARICSLPWRVLRWCFATRLRALLSSLGIFFFLGGGSYSAYTYSMSPTFCYSCHLMEPSYESWETSTHSEVTCVECHFEPGIGNEFHGKWLAVKQLASAVTGAYSSMPYAEVSDASCMRSGCHTSKELEAPVEFTARRVRFNHESHTKDVRRGMKLACTSCHFQKTVDNHMEIDKSTCFLCHFKGARHFESSESEVPNGHVSTAVNSLGRCDTCHGPPPKQLKVGRFDVDHEEFKKRGMKCVQCHVELRSGTSPVGEERCYSCHNEPAKLRKLGDVGLMHVEHVTKRKLHCYQCHTLIAHKFATRDPRVAADGKAPARQGHAPGDCKDCHSDSHGPQALLYAGRGARGVPSIPDDMHALGLDCVGCHRDPTPNPGSGENGVLAPAQSCGKCHDKRYDAFVGAFAGNARKMLEHLDKRFAAVEKKIEAIRGSGKFLDRKVYRGRETVSHNLRFLRQAVPIHNPNYAVETLRVTNETLYQLEDAVESESDDDPPIGFEKEDCEVCHGSLPKPGRLQLITGRSFPHQVHVDETGLGCADCHQGSKHPARAPTTESSCQSCHKGEKKLPDKKK